MKKMTSSLLFFLMGFLGLANPVNAQSDAILVPTYKNQSEMPAKMKPEQKMLRQLPIVVLNENGTDFTQFKAEMNKWIANNPSKLSQFEVSVNELIANKQFEQLVEVLIEMGHSKEISLVNYKGGKHE